MGDVSGTETSTAQETKHKLPIKTLVAASIGNAIEWYDWTIFATFLIYFSTQFFPAGNPELALVNTTATYAVAFFFRPVGGWMLGRFADTRGRKAAMILTITLMAGGSLAIGAAPTYEQVGWLAPILLLLARVAQGMSLGGEVSNASAYLAEIAPEGRRGRYSAFFYISTGTALLIASLLGVALSSTLTDDQLSSFGWRIPFIIGGILAVVGLYLRRSLSETQQFEENKDKAVRVHRPLLTTITHHPKAVAPAGRHHVVEHAQLLRLLQRPDAVRSGVPGRRRQRRLHRAVGRHGAVHRAALPVRQAL